MYGKGGGDRGNIRRKSRREKDVEIPILVFLKVGIEQRYEEGASLLTRRANGRWEVPKEPKVTRHSEDPGKESRGGRAS